MGRNDLLSGLLRDVSRSFYLTLRILPSRVRPQLGLAYLLARTTDTIADTTIVPVTERESALEEVRGYVAGRRSVGPDLSRFLLRPATAGAFAGQALQRGTAWQAEHELLSRIGEAVPFLDKFTIEDQRLIRAVLDTITSGQLLDLRRFAQCGPGEVVALETDAVLDDYLYRVAGCVGEFWTRICRTNIFPRAEVDEAFLLANGVRFGKGLQLTNILRDLPRDLRNGRCYLPRVRLQGLELEPADLLNSACEGRFRPVFDRYCQTAMGHLAAGWAYTNHIPKSCLRIRLACAWPVLIGKRTIERLAARTVLDTGVPIKVSRKEVKRIIARSLVACAWPALWHTQWQESRRG